MREILFRGKRKDNGEWVEGYLYIKYFQELPHGRFVIQYKPNEDVCKWTPEYMVAEVDPETVGQYTGLTDKNGKKIFEGDIVHLTDIRYNNEWKAVVVFGNPYSQYSWGWNLQYIGKKPQINTDILLWVEMEDVQVYCEVIGNIHDNPELLKSEEKVK